MVAEHETPEEIRSPEKISSLRPISRKVFSLLFLSDTTRKLKADEENGRTYHFISYDDMMEGIGKASVTDVRH